MCEGSSPPKLQCRSRGVGEAQLRVRAPSPSDATRSNSGSRKARPRVPTRDESMLCSLENQTLHPASAATPGGLRPSHELCGSWVLVPVPQRGLVLCNGVAATYSRMVRRFGNNAIGRIVGKPYKCLIKLSDTAM